MNRKNVLESAIQCVCSDRQDTHGNPENTFGSIAKHWSHYLDAKITSHDVAVMMILFKVARMKCGKFHADNYIDSAGYSALAAELLEAEEC